MQTDYDVSCASQNAPPLDPLSSPPTMSFPTSNPDHLWNEWARNQPTPQPGGRPIIRTPLMNFPCETRPQGQAMFQKPPLPPIQPRRPRTMGGTYGVGSVLLPQMTHSPFTPRTLDVPTLRTPRPRYRLSSLSRPFAILALPVQYGLAPPFARPPSSYIPPLPLESAPPPTLLPTQTRTATLIPPIMEETNLSPNERMTTPSMHMEGTTSGQNLAPLTKSSSAPIAPRFGSSDGSTLSNKALSTPRMSEYQWATTSPSPASPHFHDVEETLPWRPEYLPTETEQSAQPPLGIQYRTPTPEPRQNNASWSTTYSHWPSLRETASTWTAPPEFSGDYRGYTPVPVTSFYNALFPLPDSPNWEYQHPTNYPLHPRRIQGYRPLQYGTHPFAGQDPPEPPDNEQAGGSNNPPQPTREEQLEKARLQSQVNRNEYDLLRRQMEAARDKMTRHDMIWDFAQPPDDDNKGKKPEWGRPFVLNYRRPLHEWED
ncbi:uncharacterized protein ARMOST_02681 [Armillaria ostoyae]|uniref:Uncharacterized protein n=1 Tax=Armillaria ostoyae TaxID=47428 RepID=A0A284QSE3_ARMOS|nr:uncharacterized protein ARMOST_02681 [Armillaria ostoyae]